MDVDTTISELPPPPDPVVVGGPSIRVPKVRRSLERRPVAEGFLTLGIALAVSFAMYAVPVLSHFSTMAVGDGGADNRLNIWMLSWWPYAITHNLSLLHSGYVWAPQGVNMAWVTGLPGPSLVMWPITHAFGAIFTTNVLAVLGPALDTWAAYLLCRRVSRGRYWPAIVGGFVFGFSTYVTSAVTAHINLYLVFPVPLAVYLVVRAVEGSLKPARFVALLTLVLVAEFSISTELFLTTTVFAVAAAIGSFAFVDQELRPRLLFTYVRVGLSYLATGLVVSPYLIAALRNPPVGALRLVSGGKFSDDLLSFFLPGLNSAIGGRTAHDIVGQFHLNPVEDGAYLGLFAVLLVVAVVQLRKDRVVAAAAAFSGFAALCSLGTTLQVNGHAIIPLPWTIMGNLRIVQDALPFRFPMFMWIGIAVIVTRWLTRVRTGTEAPTWRVAARYGAVGLAMVSVFPNLWADTLHRTYSTPPYFLSRTDLRATVPEGATVVIIHTDPTSTADGYSMLWQTQAHYWFQMAQGYTGLPPQAFRVDPIWEAINRNQPQLADPSALFLYLREHHVADVLVTNPASASWGPIITTALGGVAPVTLGGVHVWRTGFGASSG